MRLPGIWRIPLGVRVCVCVCVCVCVRARTYTDAVDLMVQGASLPVLEVLHIAFCSQESHKLPFAQTVITIVVIVIVIASVIMMIMTIILSSSFLSSL
jgi:hypothetical protein